MLTEAEIFDRHTQALGEARRACQELGRNMDADYLALRGRHYVALREALKNLEGSARQAAHARQDARWLRLGIVYGQVARVIQAKFVGQKWAFFNHLQQLFVNGLRSMDDLRNRRTGRIGAILPENPSAWLVLPDVPAPNMHGPLPPRRLMN